MVIKSLTDGVSTHVPYRDSKLTRILSESLGGNSKTTLIIAASPAHDNIEETISTLKFGKRAKMIKNKTKVNSILSVAELERMLANAEKENEKLKGKIKDLEYEVKLGGPGKGN